MARKVIVMYHSVGSARHPAVVGSFPVMMDRFKHQVRAAEAAGWAFGRVSQLFDPVERDTLYLAHDDGTSDWANNVLPWCESQQIPTHIGVITGPWLDQPIYPVTHIVQVILQTRNAASLRRIALRLANRLSEAQIAYIDRMYHYEIDPCRRMIKGTINLIIDPQEATELIGELDQTEKHIMAERFAPPDRYRDYQMLELGVHTVRHTAMTLDVEAYRRDEIQSCAEHLAHAGLDHNAVFTLPMVPRYGASAEDLIEPLRTHGYRGMFNTQGFWNQQDFMIPRIDAVHLEKQLNLEPLPINESEQTAC